MLSQICSGIILVLALSMYPACFAVVTHVSCIYLKTSPCSLNYPSGNRRRHKLGTWWEHLKCVLSGIQWLWIGNMDWYHPKCSQFLISDYRVGTFTGNILNVPNLWLVIKMRENWSTVLHVSCMFPLISRGPCPQWQGTSHHRYSKAEGRLGVFDLRGSLKVQ